MKKSVICIGGLVICFYLTGCDDGNDNDCDGDIDIEDSDCEPGGSEG